jgi:hypothetical protein
MFTAQSQRHIPRRNIARLLKMLLSVGNSWCLLYLYLLDWKVCRQWRIQDFTIEYTTLKLWRVFCKNLFLQFLYSRFCVCSSTMVSNEEGFDAAISQRSVSYQTLGFSLTRLLAYMERQNPAFVRVRRTAFATELNIRKLDIRGMPWHTGYTRRSATMCRRTTSNMINEIG